MARQARKRKSLLSNHDMDDAMVKPQVQLLRSARTQAQSVKMSVMVTNHWIASGEREPSQWLRTVYLTKAARLRSHAGNYRRVFQGRASSKRIVAILFNSKHHIVGGNGIVVQRGRGNPLTRPRTRSAVGCGVLGDVRPGDLDLSW